MIGSNSETANEDPVVQSVDEEDDSIIKNKDLISDKWAEVYYLFKNFSSLKRKTEVLTEDSKKYRENCKKLENDISTLIEDLNGDRKRKRVA